MAPSDSDWDHKPIVGTANRQVTIAKCEGKPEGANLRTFSKFASRAISRRRLEKMEPKKHANNKDSAKCHRILYHCAKALSR